jgi:hypothetical protein
LKFKNPRKTHSLTDSRQEPAFFAVGGIAFGAMYVFFFQLWPEPTSWMELVNNINLELCFLAGAVAGSIVGGYATARVAKHNQFIHCALVIAMLSGLDQGYILWGPVSQWDLPFNLLWATILGYAPFFVLGTWMWSRKRVQVEKTE